jgi:hypothetical protein
MSRSVEGRRRRRKRRKRKRRVTTRMVVQHKHKKVKGVCHCVHVTERGGGGGREGGGGGGAVVVYTAEITTSCVCVKYIKKVFVSL